MADNTVLNEGTGGDTISTDDLGTVKVQRVKVQYGVDGSATDVSDTNPLPIDDAGGSITVDNGGTFAVQAAQSGTWNVTNVSGTVSLPTGASTAANQTTIIGHVDGIEGLLTTIDADTGAIAGAVSGTEMQVDVVTSALPTGASTAANQSTIIGHVDGIEGLLTTMDADTSTLAGAVSGSEMQVDVVASLPAGTNNIGDVDIASAIPAGTNVIGDVGISGARTSGGTTPYRNVDVDETEDEVKGTAGQVYWLHAVNLTAAVLYLHIYNATAASVTVGTTTPTLTFALPTQGDTNGAGFNFSVPNGIAFGTAITVACTTTVGGSSGPAVNGCILNLGYA